MPSGHDEHLRDAILDTLASTMQHSSFDIKVAVQNGIVQLMGFVDVLAEKARAEELVRGFPGVKKIENNLTVATDGGIDDDDVAEAIRQRLAEMPDNVLKGVQVTVTRGVAHLQGRVHSLAEKHGCIDAARDVMGIKEVIADLAVADHEPVDDATITNMVELALSRELKVDARQVNTSTRRGVVTLTGWVERPEAVAAAARAAAGVQGVRAIDNRLIPLRGSKDHNVKQTTRLMQELQREPHLNPGQIKAFVIGTTAYLGGEVYSQEAKESAERAARRVPGIRAVSNDIFVGTH